ncbi:cell wall-associated NlpC family hydrolase [Paenibacillus shirakamiensis]|uniref:Cell wall-associated NlpC family hydrolase n=1 Tax=Paenibacillus shirakamiensis TaxID=1265935 RepID=A0ABS4JGX4_9BACL|nr:C40 family peptidase [Paenibacillus shirakamiensis]MBP1999814.1 cell wall-associated NlpC family hydrolase [Paenibacillus shirakamiensis]
MTNKKHFFQKVLTVGLCASIGFTGLLATGAAETASAATSSTTVNAYATSTSKGQQVINYGKQYLGVRYVFGASTTTTKNFDCSSFTKHVFKKYGITLPRTAAQQSKIGKAVSRANLKVGDLVFFSSGSRANGKNVTHVGIYAGNGKILHTYGSPGVTISSLNNGGNWDRTYLKARRVL